MGKKKIFFITDTLMSFVNHDIEILKNHFDVRVIVVFHEVKNKKNPVSVVSLLYKLLKGIIWSDIIFCWFATDTAYVALRMARLFRKKSVVVIGGYEVANEPEIGYGALQNERVAARVAYILANADKIIAVSEFSRKQIEGIEKPQKMQLLYNSVDTDKFHPGRQKEDIVSTTCFVNRDTIKRKGLLTFIEAAKNVSNAEFFIVGKSSDDSIEYLRSIAPGNVTFTGFVPDDELIDLLQRSRVYCQLSFYESFGVALAEAMACGCIPVITDRGAMHEITGDIGYQVSYGDADATAEAIRKALASHDEDRARERIVENFSSEKRERELVELVEELE